MKLSSTTALYFFSIFILGAFSALTGPALPVFGANTASALNEVNIIFVLGSLGYLLGSLAGGRAYDNLPGHRLLAISLLTLAISGALAPITSQLWMLVAVMFILGLAQGTNDVGCNTLVLVSQERDPGASLNALHFFFGLGSSISPLVLAWFLSRTGDIKWTFWLFSILCLPLILRIWQVPDRPRYTQDTKSWQTTLPALSLILLVAAFAFYVGAEVGFGSWVYSYVYDLGLGTTLSAAAITSAFWSTLTVGRMLGIWFSTFIRPQVVILLDLIGALASMSLLLLWPGSRAALWSGTICAGLFMASIFPTMLLLARDRLKISGALTGWLLVGGGIGGMTLPWMIGEAFAGSGPLAMPVLILASLVLCLFSIMLFSARTARAGHRTI